MATALREPTALEHSTPREAAEAARGLSAFIDHHAQYLEVRPVNDKTTGKPVLVPAEALRLLIELLNELSQGNAVTIAPFHQEITTQQAANLLNVSRPYLVKLLDERQIPSRKVGSRRRVMLKDVLAFKQRDNDKRLAVLASLAEDAEEFGI